MSRPLSMLDWKRATRMWRAGKNTLEIAEVIGCTEALIYNKLPDWRRQFKTQALHFEYEPLPAVQGKPA